MVDNQSRFEALSRVFNALKQEKQKQLASEENREKEKGFRSDNQWLDFFDEEARSHFRWPTIQSSNVWSLPSLTSAFKDGEYELVACRMVSPKLARLEFDPFAFPYGGTECMKMLIEAFGFQITGEDDGTGYMQY
jgi:hypothetical protein